MAQPKTGLYIYGQNKVYDPSKETEILKFNDWVKNNPKSAAKYKAKGGLFNGSTSVNGAPNIGLTNGVGTPSTDIIPMTLQSRVDQNGAPIKTLAIDYDLLSNATNDAKKLVDINPIDINSVSQSNKVNPGLTDVSSAEKIALGKDDVSTIGATGATLDTKNNTSGIDHLKKLNNFFNTDGTVDMDKFIAWAEVNPEAAAGIGGLLTFDNNNIGRFRGSTSKDNTFLGLGNEGWGNVLKGGGLVLQGIGLSDQLKTNKKQREAMDFDLLAARDEKAALDKYRAAYA